MMSNSVLQILVILLVIAVVIFLLLFVYKAKLERQGDDIYRTTPERLDDKQKALLKKVDGLSKPLWIVGALVVLLVLAAVGIWVYQGLGLGPQVGG